MPQSRVRDVANRILNDISEPNDGFLNAVAWLNMRYQELVRRVHFNHLRRTGEIVLPATVDEGEVDATRGSTEVTGDATAQAAWSRALIGRYFRTRTAWYKIVDVTTTSSLILENEFAEATVDDGGYDIVSWHNTFPASVRKLTDEMYHVRRRATLKYRDYEEIKQAFPSLTHVNTLLCNWTIAGVDEATGGFDILFYPSPGDTAELVEYTYYEDPQPLDADSLLPLFIDEDILREGALIDAMRWKAGRAVSLGKMEEAAYWRNEYRAQETKWDRKVIPDCVRQNRGKNELTTILELPHKQGSTVRDITSAYDEVLARWSPNSP